jgi:kojibiose phosphorylase
MFIERYLSPSDWLIEKKGYHPEENLHNETIFTLANGYVGTRGSLEEEVQNSRPATLFSGLYDQTITYNRELINCPNWVRLEIRVNGTAMHPESGKIVEFRRLLDLKQGILAKVFRWKDNEGRVTRVETMRFLNLAHKHQGIITGIVLAENHNAMISIASMLDGGVLNYTYPRQLKVKHLEPDKIKADREDGIYLSMRTESRSRAVAEAAFFEVDARSERSFEIGKDRISEIVTFKARKGKSIPFTKYISLFNNRDTDDLENEALKELSLMKKRGWEKLFDGHLREWDSWWDRADIQIDGDKLVQKALRFSIFHLIQLSNDNDERSSIAAKGLHGEGYHGHIFWDTEIFILPFFLFTNPKVARTLLKYRFHGLKDARSNAIKRGFEGAMYPWETSDTGEEVCPQNFTNYITGTVIPLCNYDEENHIVADVAYAIDQYYRATKDDEFMARYGTEIMVETARFWASRAKWDGEKKAYVITKVIGPDEWHEHVDNSVFTNFMARWNLLKAMEYVARIQKDYPKAWSKLSKKIRFHFEEETRTWDYIAKGLLILYDPESKLYEEFEGYFKLLDPSITKYDKRGQPILPEYIRNMGQRTQLIKQADVVLLHYLMNDAFDTDTKRLNYRYYEQRTIFESSLGANTYAVMGVEVGEYGRAYRHLRDAVLLDLEDKMGNTGGGIHSAALGGAWLAVVAGFGGLRLKGDHLSLNPYLAPNWKRLAFSLCWRGDVIHISADRREVLVSLPRRPRSPIPIEVCGRSILLKNKQTRVVRGNFPTE